MFYGDYPPGVTDAMIDAYFGDDGRCCANCTYYWSDGSCMRKENAVESNYTEEEIEAMSQAEYDELISTDKDDWCDEYEAEEYEGGEW